MSGSRRHGAGRVRRTGAALVGAVLMIAVLLVPGTARAQTSDSVDSWNVTYAVGADGLLHVSETLVWRFGSSSGRHGITRTLPTREPYGAESDKQDAVYGISDVSVSSPDASDEFTTSTSCARSDPRDCTETIRIGDANTRITAATATYTIGYTVSGALRSSGDYDELYWDVVGTETPATDRITVTVDVPGGVQETRCYAGAAGSTSECTSQSITGGEAVFTQNGKAAGEMMTVSAEITAGLVSDNTPHLEKAAVSNATKALRAGLVTGGAGTAAAVGGLVVLGRRRRDERFTDVPPGTVPTDPGTAQVRPDTKEDRETIPVRVVPPDLPVAVGGLLIDGQIGTRETSAVLVDLAVRGAIQLRAEDDGAKTYARLIDASRTTQQFEQEFLRDVFGAKALSSGAGPGEVALHKPGRLLNASRQLSREVNDSAKDLGLMRHSGRVGGGSTGPLTGKFILIFTIVVFWVAGGGMLRAITSTLFGDVGPSTGVLLGLLLAAAVFGVGARRIHRRGQRTALGRALTDQVDGFYEYLKTAEADQIQFEEGQDIFSQYLPWAIAFDLTDRWARICDQLVALGRIPDTPPSWYYGDPFSFHRGFFIGTMVDSMRTGAGPVPSSGGSGFSGGGFGSSGGSAFSGGGFSGGGGGGGGAGSW
ncbi:DUF2207 domain-containing protein [uncultured Propionibacterium sp.]|uniref:DUF2207 domain-containing protein n=1 Tax=uncultured Propionibacterium sp. TaxID=218066 RepID=UPI00292F19D9|nr:DUF2207 domain-containing protein [uncultured Propionibacterium sp.]